MKTITPAFAVLLCSAALLNSCAVSKNSIAADNKVKNTTEEPLACFVQLNDGTIKHFSTLKLVTGVLKTPHLIADDKVIITAKEIIAYQDNRHYVVSLKLLTGTKSANVAVGTLPGFAVRVLSGKLNVYCRKYYNGGNTANEYFLQNGSDGYIIAYSKPVLLNLLQEDAKALAYFNSKAKVNPVSKKILVAVEMYNNGQMMTKN